MLFAGLVAIAGTVRADILEVEPDAFPELLTDLTDKFPGVILSNMTLLPETGVLVRDIGTDVPMTGQFVFGRETAISPDPRSLIIFSQSLSGPSADSSVLRADFAVPVDFVSIQSSTPDDGGFRLEAYNASDTLLEFDADSVDSGPFVFNLEIDRSSEPSPDISYILAYGVVEQDVSGPIDNLRVNFDTLPVFINIEPRDDRNRINLCAKHTTPVAILSFANFSGGLFFDATEVDPFTVDLAGAGVKRFGKDGEKAKFTIQDVNGDGLSDMIVEIETEDLGLESDDTEAELTGQRMDGTAFIGTDAVEVQQRMCCHANLCMPLTPRTFLPTGNRVDSKRNRIHLTA